MEGGQPTLLPCGAVCGGEVQEGTVPLAQLSDSFQSLPLLPTSKLDPSGADFQVGGFVYVLVPCGSLQWTLLWGWEFLSLLQPPQIFTARGFEALFPHTGTLGCTFCLAPQFFLLVYLYANVGLPSSPAATLPTWSSSCCLATHPLHPSCQYPPLLPVWMSVSLTPWLLDFHTGRFSGNYSCFMFLNLLLSFFWLCEEAQCIYLHLYLG